MVSEREKVPRTRMVGASSFNSREGIVGIDLPTADEVPITFHPFDLLSLDRK